MGKPSGRPGKTKDTHLNLSTTSTIPTISTVSNPIVIFQQTYWIQLH